MRIVHTSDIHLDMCYSGLGLPASYGNRRRQSLREVFKKIVERAGQWPADALLIAGDLFEHDRVSRDTIAFIIGELRTIPEVPVFIAPGNHDPCQHDSPYTTENWPRHVTIFRTPRWESVSLHDGALTVHGFGFDGPDISTNPFGKLAIPESDHDQVHVAVAHGSERGHQPPEKRAYAAFDARDAAPQGLDYLALGHFHTAMRIEGAFDATLWYAGAPEGHSLRETGVHHYLEVEIEDGQVRVMKIPSSRVVYTSSQLACDDYESAQDIIDAVRVVARSEDARQIARIVLTGSIEPSIHSELGLVYDAASLDFEHLYLVDRTMPLEDYEELAREDTSLGIFIRRLNNEIGSAEEEGARQKRVRARELGVAAFRNRELEVRGLERS